MITREAVTRVVERAYAAEESEERWLEGIHDAAVHAFDGHVSVMVYTVHAATDGRNQLATRVGDRNYARLMTAAHEFATPDEIQTLYFSGPVARAGAYYGPSGSAPSTERFQQSMKELGGIDVLGTVGMDTTGHACVIAYLVRRTKIAAAERSALARIGGHLATAYRLRRGLGSRPPGPGEAVFGADGRVLEAGMSRDRPQELTSLQSAVQAIDRAKRGARRDPQRALAYWKAMVDGQYTLVEHRDTDGRRFWIARENPPAARAHHALSVAEQRVVALASICRPSKAIAYELGFTQSVVSRLLTSAFGKLGVKTRSEFLEVHGAIVGSDDGGDSRTIPVSVREGTEGTEAP